MSSGGARVFHGDARKMFPLVAEAIGKVLPLERLRYVAFSHFEADECGSLNDFLAAAPGAVPVCSRIGAMVSVDDYAARPARALADGEVLATGKHRLRWLDTPHVPHGWECGFMMELETRTLLCGDFFTQPGSGATPLTDGDILGPSEALRAQMEYYSHAPATASTLERLAGEQPQVLACMHGSAWLARRRRRPPPRARQIARLARRRAACRGRLAAWGARWGQSTNLPGSRF